MLITESSGVHFRLGITFWDTSEIALREGSSLLHRCWKKKFRGILAAKPM